MFSQFVLVLKIKIRGSFSPFGRHEISGVIDRKCRHRRIKKTNGQSDTVGLLRLNDRKCRLLCLNDRKRRRRRIKKQRFFRECARVPPCLKQLMRQLPNENATSKLFVPKAEHGTL